MGPASRTTLFLHGPHFALAQASASRVWLLWSLGVQGEALSIFFLFFLFVFYDQAGKTLAMSKADDSSGSFATKKLKGIETTGNQGAPSHRDIA